MNWNEKRIFKWKRYLSLTNPHNAMKNWKPYLQFCYCFCRDRAYCKMGNRKWSDERVKEKVMQKLRHWQFNSFYDERWSQCPNIQCWRNIQLLLKELFLRNCRWFRKGIFDEIFENNKRLKDVLIKKRDKYRYIDSLFLLHNNFHWVKTENVTIGENVQNVKWIWK